MINRDNYQAVKAFFAYRREVSGIDPRTETVQRGRLRHLLTWADDTPFTSPKIEQRRPTFPAYIAQLRPAGNMAKGDHFVPEMAKKIVDHARTFFAWARVHRPEYRNVSAAWIDTLRPPRMDRPIRERKVVTVEMVRALIAADFPGLRGRRVKAAAAFLFLSGIRATAFETLPILAVDVDARTVKQLPALGVRTKNRKSAVTYLLDIPDLLAVVREWDEYVRGELPAEAAWFAPLGNWKEGTVFGLGESYLAARPRTTNNSGGLLRKDIGDLFKAAGLPYHSPHKFRHGHATYGLKLARDIGELKAVSQNLMHANIGITDGVYAILSADDLQERIAALGRAAAAPPASMSVEMPAPPVAATSAEIAAIVEETVKRMMSAQQAAQIAPPAAAEPTRPAAPRKGKRRP